MTTRKRKITARLLFHCGPLHNDQFERRLYATRASEKETPVAVLDLSDKDALLEQAVAAAYQSANPSKKWANASDMMKKHCYKITRATFRAVGIKLARKAAR